MRTCLSFLVVEYMRQGISVGEACKKGIERLLQGGDLRGQRRVVRAGQVDRGHGLERGVDGDGGLRHRIDGGIGGVGRHRRCDAGGKRHGEENTEDQTRGAAGGGVIGLEICRHAFITKSNQRRLCPSKPCEGFKFR